MSSAASVVASASPPAGAAATRLYGRIWRWHFFSALIVIPFVLWQSVTGAVYLWHREIAGVVYPELLRVEPRDGRVGYELQLAAAVVHWPVERLEGIEISDDPARSTAFFFRDDNGLAFPAFVDPYTGHYLGAVPSTHWVAGLSRGLHGGWPINPFGSYLLELGASWAIVMILTGLYLWWPRGARGGAGALYPRLHEGARTFWRDLHATVGVYFSLIALAFLFSALPWTTLWGDMVLKPLQRATGQVSPATKFAASGDDHHHAAQPGASAHSHASHAHRRAAVPSLDELIERARAAGVNGAIEIRPNASNGRVEIRSQRPRTSQEVLVQFDSRSGAMLGRAGWQDYSAIPKVVSTGIDLHEGRFFGRANQVFNTLVAAALVWLAVTGFIGWYRRRPAGSLAAPPRRALAFPRTVIGTAALLCCLLPMFGASLLVLWLADMVIGRQLALRASRLA